MILQRAVRIKRPPVVRWLGMGADGLPPFPVSFSFPLGNRRKSVHVPVVHEPSIAALHRVFNPNRSLDSESVSLDGRADGLSVCCRRSGLRQSKMTSKMPAGGRNRTESEMNDMKCIIKRSNNRLGFNRPTSCLPGNRMNRFRVHFHRRFGILTEFPTR